MASVDEIVTQFQVPTLLLDATLPNRSLLEIYHPHVKIVADINCAMPPHVRIRQFLRTPTSSNKLDSEKHLEAVRRAILQRWFETGRQPALVICQMKVEEWLLGKLPDNIAVEHYNNIAGLDQYKDVRLLMLVGRVAPGPEAVEAHAGALTGIMPKLTATNSGGFRWFEAVKRGIRLRDGSGVATTCDFHPDPVAEAVRWQIHEAELIQALGRARGVNRTAETPLDVDLLLDTCLPVTVDAVEAWQRPSLLIAAAAEGGVMLTNPKDMVKLWPDLWPNDNAADRCLKGGVPSLPGFVPVKYQLAGPKQKHRTAMIDPAAVPDPTAWLQERLGPLRKKSL